MEKMQKTVRHTVGPWRVGFSVNIREGLWTGWRETDILNEEGCFLSLFQYHQPDESDANARLIAAAPELLTALRQLYQRTLNVFEGDEEYMLAQAGSPESLRVAKDLLDRLE